MIGFDDERWGRWTRPILFMAALLAPLTVAAATAPYPPSTRITGVTFDWGTHRQLAPGSDNWAITWSADDQQYTVFGDGGGFGGNEVKGRVSLGVSRIEGSGTAYRGVNLWGGVGAKATAGFNGKSYGILAVGTELYMWRCGAGSMATAFDFQQLYRSTNSGASWQAANWMFPGGTTFYCPTFLQQGRAHAGAVDGYAYMYAAERTSGEWGVHKPGKIMLMRAPAERLMDRAAYEFFTGRSADGGATWSADVGQRKPVFEDPNGVHLVAVTHAAGVGRYLLSTIHGVKNEGSVGLFDAPAPWGPWTTTLYEERWGAGHVEPTTFFMNFAPKWWTDEGRGFTLVFTGVGDLDSWNTVRGTFALDGAPASAPIETGPIAEKSGVIPPAMIDSGEVASGSLLDACSTIAGNRGWTAIDARATGRQNAKGHQVTVMRGQRFGEDRRRRCLTDAAANDSRFDDQR